MNVLITGGTGTVGRRVVARLVRAGHTVRVIGLDEDLEIPGAEFRRSDITDYAALREQVSD
jgi:nucleoside-diphosphate-sugar epimerase